MDARTTNLLRALDGTAVEILIALLESPLPEKALLKKVGGATQSAVNKKLQRLEQAGLIGRSPAAENKRGLPWSIIEPGPTATLLKAILSLATALDAVDQHTRQTKLDRLAKIKNAGPKLRVVGSGDGT
jgi:DNA-binding MarR family transcriptional regulator